MVNKVPEGLATMWLQVIVHKLDMSVYVKNIRCI